MLIEFSVENYLSFKDKTTFSMVASSDKEHEEQNVIKLPDGKRLLKSAAIYGANASGKSNLLIAMDFVGDFVNTSHKKQIGTKVDVVPFKLDRNCLEQPSKFEIQFIAKDNIKYAYGFSATTDKVVEEYLYYYPNGRQAMIFERSATNNYKFTTDIDVQNAIKNRNTENKLYLSTASNWNYGKLGDAFSYLSHFQILDEGFELAYLASLKNDDPVIGKFILETLKEWLTRIDVGIKNIKFYSREKGADIRGASAYEVLKNTKTIHQSHDGRHEIELDMLSESSGTQRMLSLARGMITSLYAYQQLILIDELDCHLHPLLSKFIMKQFNSTENNVQNSQLIFTTHDTNLLDLSLLRRDQIYFTEKNPDTGASDLYSLYDFGVRKDANIEKGYLMGKYGAIPFIGGLYE